MLLHCELVKSDVIFCLCSHDTRVAERAADLMMDGYGKYLVISGGLGKLTKDIFTKSEAEIFADVAIARGVPRKKIIIESHSTNTAENVTFTYELLKSKKIIPKSIILVQKPYMERRTYATFMQQWPGDKPSVTVTSPLLSYEGYLDYHIPKKDVLSIMVGDLQRIREYPKLGFQIEQKIPPNVWDAYEQLVRAGFTSHLIQTQNQSV